MPNAVIKSFPLRVSPFGFMTLALALTAGCATAPPTQEMSDARQSLEAAQTIGAEKHAPKALDNAQQLLSQAESDMQTGNYENAQKDAIAAREAARQAVAISQARQKQEPPRQIEGAAEKSRAIPKPEPTPEPAPEPVTQIKPEPAMPKEYVVEARDNLWGIAAKPSVYGDPRLWPLLLKANANLIKTPDVIEPGITLRIERSPTPEEIEAALNYSSKRGKGPLKSTDIGYLRQYGLR